MAISHVGAGTVLHATSVADANEVKSDVFADARASAGVVATCFSVGAGGVLKVYKVMKHSGEEVEIESEAVTAGTANPTVIDIDFPLGVSRASFQSDAFGSVTQVEIEMRSKGR